MRRLSNIIAALSLLLLSAVCVFWVMSYRDPHFILVSKGSNRFWSVEYSHGALYFDPMTDDVTDRGPIPMVQWVPAIYEWYEPKIGLKANRWLPVRLERWLGEIPIVIVAFWPLAFALSILPAAWVRRRISRLHWAFPVVLSSPPSPPKDQTDSGAPVHGISPTTPPT
jgi:hypothetical protein